MKHYTTQLTLALLFIGFGLYASNPGQNLSSVYIQNKGQVANEKGLPTANVLFYTQGTAMQVFVTTSGYSLVTTNYESDKTTYNKINIALQGATINAANVLFTDSKGPKLNYYNQNHKLQSVKSSQTVIVRDIYPGIDWVWHFNANQKPEHSFMVNLGADAGLIKYKIDGADATTRGNNIVYSNKAMQVKEGPVMYQHNNYDFAGNVVVADNTVSFVVPDSLKEGGFTIDPPLELLWGSAINPQRTSFRSIARDSSYCTITVGYSSDYAVPTFPQVNGSYAIYPAHNTDVLIMKTDINQNLIWATFFGGVGDDGANAVTTSTEGIFITGYSESWNFPQAAYGNSYNHAVSLTSRDAFIAWFDNEGKWKWSTGYGSDSTDEGTDIRYYNQKLWVCGYTGSDNFPVVHKPGAYNAPHTGDHSNDGFILEITPQLNVSWATCFGGRGQDYITSLYTDETGIYFTGYSDSISTTIPLMQSGTGYYQNTYTNTEAFIGKLSTTDSLQWSTYYGGPGKDVASCILKNSKGIFICGKTTADSLPVMDAGNGSLYNSNYSGGPHDGFIAGFNAQSLEQVYGTYYGTTGDDVLTKMAFDYENNIILTGYSDSAFTAVGDTNLYIIRNQIQGGYDGLMLGIDSALAPFWATMFGSTGDDFGYSVQFPHKYLVDMVGEGFYNYGKYVIGGTYVNPGCTNLNYCPQVTSNGVSNRFFNVFTFNGGPGQPGGGNGSGGGIGSCGSLLQFQALIPHKNTCPNQCNGFAEIDTANINGCPPYNIYWSNGHQGLSDTSLCELYWSTIEDTALQRRTIYGRFNVLKVVSSEPAKTYCIHNPATVPWDSLIHIAGGGPPYTITYRGVSVQSCPYTAFLDISDTAGCILSYSLPWYQYNAGLTVDFSLNDDCKLSIDPDFPVGACISIPNGSYYVINDNNVPDTIPANGIQNINLGSAQQGHLYTGYLDINGCQISMPSVYNFAPIQDSVTITKACQDPTGSISIVIQPDSIALSRLGGYTVHVSVSGIDTNFTVEQNIGFNSNTPQTVVINNLPPSRYRLNCYYDNTCDTTKQVYDLRTVQFHFQSPLLLCGQPDTVYAIMDGGLAPYTYQWSVPAGNVPWLLAPAAGNYTLTITDALGCSFSNAINVLASAPVVIDTVFENRQPCTNNLFSNSQVIYHGGSAPVSIVWSSGETGTIASYIPQGNSNWVRVYDAVGCADTVEFANTKQLPVQQTNTHTDITCYSADDGTIQLTATNGYPPYTYWWSGQQGNSSLGSLSPGSYYYQIIDSRGCSTGGVITLSEPNNIQLAITTSDAACTSATGEIFVSAWGGTGQLTIDWGNGVTGSSISNLSAGTYTFIVTDENNCSKQGSAVVGTASPITATYTQTDVSCYNGNNGNATITIANAELPVTYTWSNSPNNTPSITGLQAGVYTVNVADAVGCTYQHTFYITQPTQLIALVDTGAGITCNNSTTFVSVYGVGGTPPYSGTSNSNQYAGPYQYTITDSKGCSATVNFNISEPPPITVNATILENPGCINNGVIHLNVTGGIGPYILQDINGSTTFTDSTTAYGIYAGNYTATITDSLGCSKPVNVAINSTSTLHVTSTLVQPTCTDSWGHINITATGGVKPYTIILSGSQYTFTDSVSIPVSQGFYTIDVTDSVMCHYSVSGNIVPWVNFYYGTQTKAVSCNGGNDGELTITVYGGQKPYMYNGAIVDSTFTISDLTAGLYTDSITDAYGCQLIFNYVISEPSALLIDSVNQIDSITCYGRNNASIQVFVHGGTPFYTYQLTGNGVNIIQQQGIFTSLPPGTFTITVTDSFGCQKLLNVTINQFTHAHHRVDIDTVSCYGKNDGAIKLYSEPAYRNTYTYSLNNGEPQVHNVFYSLTADTYQIVVSDNTGCTDTLQVTVPQPEQIDGRVWLNEVLLPVDSFVLLERLFADFTKHNLNPWTVDFSPDIPRIEQSDTLVKVLPRESLTYTVTVYMDSIDKTCFVQYTGFIDLLNVPPLPNIVTPNGDGYNDTWEIDLDKFPGAEVTIFDRWGEIIYESKEYRNDWDLRYHGKLLADGTYFYILKVPAQGNRIYKGDINVLNASK